MAEFSIWLQIRTVIRETKKKHIEKQKQMRIEIDISADHYI